MKQIFQKVPWSVRAAVLAIGVYPIAICGYSFRLYAHPKNPDAWFVVGVLEAVYLLIAYAILKRSRLARWFCVCWVAVNLVLGLTRFDRFSGEPSLQVFIVTCWLIQIAVISLLFLPSAKLHFQKTEPNQSLQPTAPSGRG
jgi:hypothetical protein